MCEIFLFLLPFYKFFAHYLHFDFYSLVYKENSVATCKHFIRISGCTQSYMVSNCFTGYSIHYIYIYEITFNIPRKYALAF